MHAAHATFAPLVGLYLDVDGTIFIQLVIFWFVVGFVHFVLVKPYMQVVEAREEGIGGSKDDAAEMEARADQLREEYEEKKRQARREAQEVRQNLRNQGVQEQNEMFEDVREELREKVDSERKSIQQKVDQAHAQLEGRAKELASTMVNKVMPQA